MQGCAVSEHIERAGIEGRQRTATLLRFAKGSSESDFRLGAMLMPKRGTGQPRRGNEDWIHCCSQVHPRFKHSRDDAHVSGTRHRRKARSLCSSVQTVRVRMEF